MQNKCERLIKDFEKENQLKFERLKGSNVEVIFPSFGSMFYHPRKYSKNKRIGVLVDKVSSLKESMKKEGVNAKFIGQDTMLKFGIVGGAFGIAYDKKSCK